MGQSVAPTNCACCDQSDAPASLALSAMSRDLAWRVMRARRGADRDPAVTF